MPRIITMSIMALLMSIMCSVSAGAQTSSPSPQSAEQAPQPGVITKKEPTIAELEERSSVAFAEKNWLRYYGANIRMLNQRPFEPIYMQRIVVACSMLERLNTAYHYMLTMQQMGLSYDLTQDPGTENLRHTELFTYLNDQMIDAGEPMGVADPVFTLGEEYSDPTALTWDAGRERFLVGTESQGMILAVADSGSSDVLIQANDQNGLWSIRGLHADAENNRLWVSTAETPAFSAYQATDQARSALLELNLESLEILNRFDVPVDNMPHEFGPIAVTGAGDVYVIDHSSSRVYVKSAESEVLQVFIGSNEMTALRSIAVKPDNTRLYIADYYKGVLVVDPVQQVSAILEGPENTNFGGIVSLIHEQENLIIVQSDYQPQRVVQFGLDASGGNVLSRLPVASGMTEFDHPGLALVKDNSVYYFANLGNGDDTSTTKPALLMRSPMAVETEIPVLNSAAGNEPQG